MTSSPPSTSAHHYYLTCTMHALAYTILVAVKHSTQPPQNLSSTTTHIAAGRSASTADVDDDDDAACLSVYPSAHRYQLIVLTVGWAVSFQLACELPSGNLDDFITNTLIPWLADAGYMLILQACLDTADCSRQTDGRFVMDSDEETLCFTQGTQPDGAGRRFVWLARRFLSEIAIVCQYRLGTKIEDTCLNSWRVSCCAVLQAPPRTTSSC